MYSYEYTLLIWKKVTKMVSCCIVYNETTKPLWTFLVGDQIKAKLIELRFRCHMPAANYAIRIATKADETRRS